MIGLFLKLPNVTSFFIFIFDIKIKKVIHNKLLVNKKIININ